ncbi:3-ketoacyl-CoA reductase [Roridomyces roridus]|uniref:Very-long-chain 3-oxoacyl-CoA reductase n=1 Tax=Roridomyces roridus TaxID=1738132 RepID=A0AAD7FX06_9AGAR|nr:3-ketoacyl-CoA reductase [Roridomyces roridus]
MDSAQSFVSSQPWYISLLLAVGSVWVLRFGAQTLAVLGQVFLLPGTSLKKFGAKKGAWAVVTGASDGIGKEFALQLGKAGFNVLLVARNATLLNTLGAEIESASGVKTRVHVIDFSNSDEAAYIALSSAIDELDVGVLVNNVGKSHAMPAYLVDVPLDEMKDIVAINVGATLRVTHATLPGMVTRKRGLILNIGSFAGSVPSPMLATYSGTKAFLSTFSAALDEEVRRKGIVVEHVNTYFVTSKLSKIRRPSMLIPTPKAFVRSVLSKIGLPCGAAFSGRPATSTPFWSHAIIDYAMTVISAPALFVSYTHGLHKSIRARALKKKAKGE